ncbi:hypothetical protein ABPG72_020018 [Tetrahymena utriculariae]
MAEDLNGKITLSDEKKWGVVIGYHYFNQIYDMLKKNLKLDQKGKFQKYQANMRVREISDNEGAYVQVQCVRDLYKIRELYGVDIGYDIVYSTFKCMVLKYGRQQSQYILIQKIEQNRKQFCKDYSHKPLTNILFTDESTFSLKDNKLLVWYSEDFNKIHQVKNYQYKESFVYVWGGIGNSGKKTSFSFKRMQMLKNIKNIQNKPLSHITKLDLTEQCCFKTEHTPYSINSIIIYERKQYLKWAMVKQSFNKLKANSPIQDRQSLILLVQKIWDEEITQQFIDNTVEHISKSLKTIIEQDGSLIIQLQFFYRSPGFHHQTNHNSQQNNRKNKKEKVAKPKNYDLIMKKEEIRLSKKHQSDDKTTSPFSRGFITANRVNKRSVKQYYEQLSGIKANQGIHDCINIHTIYKIYKQWDTGEDLSPKYSNCGSVKKINQLQEDVIINRFSKNPTQIVRKTQQNDEINFEEVSKSLIHNILKSSGLNTYKRTWTQKWKTVLFAEECILKKGKVGNRFIWQTSRDEIKAEHSFEKRRILFWSYYKIWLGAITVSIQKNFLNQQNIELIDWPPKGSYLNPIERIGFYLKEEMNYSQQRKYFQKIKNQTLHQKII